MDRTQDIAERQAELVRMTRWMDRLDALRNEINDVVGDIDRLYMDRQNALRAILDAQDKPKITDKQQN